LRGVRLSCPIKARTTHTSPAARKNAQDQRNIIRGNLQKQDLSKLVPEVRGRLLASLTKLEMTINAYDDDSFSSILQILNSATRAHEFKWVVRNAQFIIEPESGNDYAKQQAFEEGKRRLYAHGENLSTNNRTYAKYKNDLNDLFENYGSQP
jgi:hypothetical protein